MMTDERLNEMAKKVFGRFKVVKAEFSELADMKIRWERSIDFIHLYVSDYLMDMPESAMESVLRRIDGGIRGEPIEYSQECIDYFLSEDFRKRNLEQYLKRNNIALSEQLSDIAKDYFDDGDDFVGSLEGITFGTMEYTDIKASILFRVVALSQKVMDSDDVLPELYAGIRYANTEFPNKPPSMEDLRREFFTYYTDGYGV